MNSKDPIENLKKALADSPANQHLPFILIPKTQMITLLMINLSGNTAIG